MPRPGILTGNNLLASAFGSRQTNAAGLATNVDSSFVPQQRRGVFGRNPGSTPKYAINRGPVKAEYEDTTARLFVDIPVGARRDAFKKSVSKRAEPLADVLTSGSGTGGAGGTGFIDFILTSSNEIFQEKAQIVDTLTDNYVAYYSGQEPPVFGYNGVLLNTYQDDQRVWMLLMYREILRGTRLAHRNLAVSLRYDSFIVTGYLESLNLSLSGETDNTASQFSFTMRVKSMQIITDDLSRPTLNGSASTGTSVIDRVDELSTETNPRNMLVTGSYSSSNLNVPAGTVAAARQKTEQERSIAILKASGKTDAEIQGIITLAKAAEAERNSTPNTDSRAIETNANAQAINRATASATGTDSRTSNVDNITADGQQGSSNIRGAERTGTAPQLPAVYTPPYTQSGLTPDNSQAAFVVGQSAQGYQSLVAKLKAIKKKRTRGRYIQETQIRGTDGAPVTVRITT